jgi:putative nucleotidyltransferase with HDIG domain
MKVATPQDMIDIDALRVGMFVHLDMGWMSHPFPLGSFKITSAEQMATIRTLGLKRLRWSPQQSDPADAPEPEVQAWGALGEPGVSLAPPDADVPTGDGSSPDPEAEPTTLTPEAVVRERHVRRLAEQREALVVCERQFAEASHACQQLTALVPSQPQQARDQAEALTTALLQKMLGEQDVCIRLLSDAAGDKASAHALNVTIISLLMGRSFGLDAEDMMELGLGAMLHDIGKIELPERMRHRDEAFSATEARLYEEHVAHGVTIGRKMGLSAGALLVIAQHHEHADASGFPLRLNADRMTAAARIVSLVNRYDNLCNPHLPGRALTPHESLSLLFAQGRNKFDTAILGGFIKMMGVYPAGSTVQLTDDRYAMVVGVNSSRPLKPRVLVHEPAVPREEALVLDLESVSGLGIRRSLKPLQLPPSALEYLAPRPRAAYFFEPMSAEPLAA